MPNPLFIPEEPKSPAEHGPGIARLCGRHVATKGARARKCDFSRKLSFDIALCRGLFPGFSNLQVNGSSDIHSRPGSDDPGSFRLDVDLRSHLRLFARWRIKLEALVRPTLELP
jgi:hypothetical protein